ncbi:hypothetical protein LCGC14_0781420 [marine sediment metagenome]|uniref:Uncharacterized protein n=1 Tax=marine sediment metagenome TaxID=412755 RepID=A0A0F9PVI7_9ZZZZ
MPARVAVSAGVVCHKATSASAIFHPRNQGKYSIELFEYGEVLTPRTQAM